MSIFLFLTNIFYFYCCSSTVVSVFTPPRPRPAPQMSVFHITWLDAFCTDLICWKYILTLLVSVNHQKKLGDL